MARTGIVDDRMVQRIREGWEAGLSVRASARKLGVSPDTVSKHRTRLGLCSAAAPQTANAVARVRSDARQRRSEIHERSAEIVQGTLEKITGPYVERGFSQSKACWVEVVHPEPPSRNAADYARTCRELMSVHREAYLLDREGEVLDEARNQLSVVDAFVRSAAGQLGAGEYDYQRELAPMVGMLPPVEDAPVLDDA